jgi:hypothetical protein
MSERLSVVNRSVSARQHPKNGDRMGENGLTRESHGQKKAAKGSPHARIIVVFGKRREIFELTKSSTAKIIEYHSDANNDCKHIRRLKDSS